MAAEERTRTEVHYLGQVQGVGFRQKTFAIASDYRVGGYVTNLSDGRVLVVAEGVADEVASFLAEVEASLKRFIDGASVRQAAATGEFQSFEIKY